MAIYSKELLKCNCHQKLDSRFLTSLTGLTCMLLPGHYVDNEICCFYFCNYLGRVKQIWYLSLMRAAKVQVSLRIRAVSPEPPLLSHTSSESRGAFRQKAKSLGPSEWLGMHS